MRKVHKYLTKEQQAKGIFFSSTLSKYKTETMGDLIHEVAMNDPRRDERIRNLRDDKFFRGSPWSYNIIRSGTRRRRR